VQKLTELDQLLKDFESRPVGTARRHLIMQILRDATVSFNVLYRNAELFSPGEQLALSRRAFDAIGNRPSDERSALRAKVLLGICWVLSKSFRNELIDFIATRPLVAFEVIRTPPAGMRLVGLERAKLVKAISTCPNTSLKVLRRSAATGVSVQFSQSETLLLARSALNSGERKKLFQILREKELLPWRTIRQLAKAA
jgi:hypothetical protein